MTAKKRKSRKAKRPGMPSLHFVTDPMVGNREFSVLAHLRSINKSRCEYVTWRTTPALRTMSAGNAPPHSPGRRGSRASKRV
jgi:hypothetical protein